MKKEQALKEDIIEEVETTETIETEDIDVSSILELKANYEKSQKEIEELKDQLLRRQAEFENFRKRTQKEKASLMTYASESLLTELLPSLDSFERAIEVEVDKNSKPLYEGVVMVYNQLIEVLKNHGLEEVECLNEKFDHNCHHAVVQQESDEHDEDTVIQVLGKGYKYKDKIIRPSMVMVSK